MHVNNRFQIYRKKKLRFKGVYTWLNAKTDKGYGKAHIFHKRQTLIAGPWQEWYSIESDVVGIFHISSHFA